MTRDAQSLDRWIAQAAEWRKLGPAGRYAPSPTGPLHLGNLRTALLAWLQARLAGARFVLRMEDLDQPRVRPGSADRIMHDLRWLGLDWDEGPDVGGPSGPYTQSERQPIYELLLETLQKEKRLFPCWCSRKDISQAASAPHGAERVYPGTCRDLSDTERTELSGHCGDRLPAWRYRVPPRTIEFEDRLLGRMTENLASQTGDFVIRRADRVFAYHFAVVVDDSLMGITDVVRGADLLGSTARQIELFNALGFAVPVYWHVPLMCEDGKRLAKRDSAHGLDALLAVDARPPDVVGRLAASAGLIESGIPLSARELLQELTLDELARRILAAGHSTEQ